VNVPYGTQHQATSYGGAQLLYECGSCGYEDAVDVHAEGTGFSFDIGFAGGGADEARSAADRSRYHNANGALCFARCPRCRGRLWGGIARFLLTELAIGGALGVLIGLAAAFVAWTSDAGALLVALAAVAGPVLSLGVRALLLWSWLPDAIASVKFARGAVVGG
jgi:hypothetical protein